MRGKTLLFCALLLACLTGRAAAVTGSPAPALPEGFSEQADAAGADKLQSALPSDAQDILGKSDLQDAQMGQKGLSSLGKALTAGFTKSFQAALRQAAALLPVLPSLRAGLRAVLGQALPQKRAQQCASM